MNFYTTRFDARGDRDLNDWFYAHEAICVSASSSKEDGGGSGTQLVISLGGELREDDPRRLSRLYGVLIDFIERASRGYALLAACPFAIQYARGLNGIYLGHQWDGRFYLKEARTGYTRFHQEPEFRFVGTPLTEQMRLYTMLSHNVLIEADLEEQMHSPWAQKTGRHYYVMGEDFDSRFWQVFRQNIDPYKPTLPRFWLLDKGFAQNADAIGDAFYRARNDGDYLVKMDFYYPGAGLIVRIMEDRLQEELLGTLRSVAQARGLGFSIIGGERPMKTVTVQTGPQDFAQRGPLGRYAQFYVSMGGDWHLGFQEAGASDFSGIAFELVADRCRGRPVLVELPYIQWGKWGYSYYGAKERRFKTTRHMRAFDDFARRADKGALNRTVLSYHVEDAGEEDGERKSIFYYGEDLDLAFWEALLKTLRPGFCPVIRVLDGPQEGFDKAGRWICEQLNRGAEATFRFFHKRCVLEVELDRLTAQPDRLLQQLALRAKSRGLTLEVRNEVTEIPNNGQGGMNTALSPGP